MRKRYLLQQVETAQRQVSEGDVEDSVAGALASYTREMEFARQDAKSLADKIDRKRDEAASGFFFGEGGPVEDELHELVRELLLQLKADIIASQTDQQNDSW